MKFIPEHEITFEATRSSGPGGQHVQKTSSRVTLRWNIFESTVLNESEVKKIQSFFATRISKDGDFIIHVQTHRSQHRNKRIAIKLLHDLLAEALRTKKIRKKTKPSKKEKRKRLEAKIKQGQKKQQRRKVIEY